MSTLQTEYEFTLPKGYVDKDGTLHKRGIMRLATARDEIEPMRDARVGDNEAYLTIILLSRVVTDLGDVSQVTTKTIEGLFAADLAYLQDFYGAINFGDPDSIAAVEEAAPAHPKAVADESPPAEVAEVVSTARGRTRRAS